jgi:dihydrofolate reductase
MGWNTWRSIGRPLPDRLNIVLSRSETVESRSGFLLMRSRDEVLALAGYLKCDVFIIGGKKTYQNFADVIDKWIVTEVPQTVEDADVFMPKDFTSGFLPGEQIELEDGLIVKYFSR